MSHPLRDYGLGDMKLDGVPRFTGFSPDDAAACPNCGCTSIAVLQVDVVNARLIGGRGVGTYMGCPACPWASPMVCVAVGAKPKEEPS